MGRGHGSSVHSAYMESASCGRLQFPSSASGAVNQVWSSAGSSKAGMVGDRGAMRSLAGAAIPAKHGPRPGISRRMPAHPTRGRSLSPNQLWVLERGAPAGKAKDSRTIRHRSGGSLRSPNPIGAIMSRRQVARRSVPGCQGSPQVASSMRRRSPCARTIRALLPGQTVGCQSVPAIASAPKVAATSESDARHRYSRVIGWGAGAQPAAIRVAGRARPSVAK